MAKRLVLKIIASDDFGGTAIARVVEQTHRNHKFAYRKKDDGSYDKSRECREFVASNGIEIHSCGSPEFSCDSPEFSSSDSILYVRGDYPDLDDRALLIPTDKVIQLSEAIREYNTVHADEGTEPPEVAAPETISAISITLG